MIVIDASALAKYLLREEGWREVGRYLRERGPLLTLDLALKEAANALWKHCRLRGAIDPATAVEVFRGLVRLIETGAIEVEDESRYLAHALEIALQHGLPVYVSLYLAQALKHGELLTSDERQAEVAGKLHIVVHYLP